MDARLLEILQRQRTLRFRGLAGSEAGGTIRLSDQLLNELIAAGLPRSGAVKSLTLRSREGNWLDATLVLAKPPFMPPLSFELSIDRQPELPADPVLGFRLAGGAGAVLKLAGSALGHAITLPPGVRIEGDRVLVDIRDLLRQRGLEGWLDYVQQVCVSTEEAGIAVIVLAKIT